MKLFQTSIHCFLFISILLFSTSCLTTKTNVGMYQQKQGTEQTFEKGKQLWLFWGLVPLGRTNVATPQDGDCQVVTKFKFTDVLISGLTGGILYSYSIEVKVKK
jgi:hypothetical protein